MDPSKPTKKQVRTLERYGARCDQEDFHSDAFLMLSTGHALVALYRDASVEHLVVDRDGRLLDRKDAIPVLKSVAADLK